MLDAKVEPPTHVMTFTTADPEMGSERFTRGVQSVTQRIRRHYGRFEYFLKVEFTTGRAERSGGYRRIHGHLCSKGLAGEDVRLVEGLVRQTWERSTGAVVVEVAEMITPAGALHYLGIHHGKVSQAPPDDWRGQVERFTEGYLYAPVPVVREEARRQLAAEGLAYFTGATVADARLLIDSRADWKALAREEAQRAREALRELAAAERASERDLEAMEALDAATQEALFT